jgi:antitoxin component YwqK of YwqJK toxin-antitoxin module
MKTNLVIVFAALTLCLNMFAQENIPCYGEFIVPDLVLNYKQDSSGYWFSPKTDTNLRCFVSRDMEIYRHYNRITNKLLVEGSFAGRIYTDAYCRFGEWKEYYEEGGVKTIGHYYENNPIGKWQYFYPNGQLKEEYNIALIEAHPASSYCKVGSYQYYYPNGQLKIDGYYSAAVDSTKEIRYDVDGNEFMIDCVKPISKPFGIWTYYSESGSIERREKFEDFINPFLWYQKH